MHDLDYREKIKTREKADKDFRWCLERVAPGWIARTGFIAVRVCGWFFWKFT